VLGSAVAAVSLALLLGTLAGPIGLLPLVLVPLGVWLFIGQRMRRERRLFGDQLADHLAVVGGSLRVGHSLTGALTSALDEAPDPARREFARAVADERLGMPLEEALEDVAERMDNREVEHISLLAKLQREAGADAGEMVDQVVTTVRERQELRRMVRTLTAQGRFSQLVLTLLPIGSLSFLTFAYNDYVQPLYTTTPGNIVLGVAAVLLFLGALAIRKIVTFKV
jgi:tight adherence protein B